MKKIICLYIFSLLFFSVAHGQSDIQADIKNREKWKETWENVRKRNEENWSYTVYNPADLKTLSIDYSRGRADYILPVKYKINLDCVRLYNEIK